jgi:hypothetical protein
MTSADRREFAKLLGRVYELYRNPLTGNVADIWRDALAPWPLDEIKVAFDKHIREPAGHFAPMPADIIAKLGRPPGAPTRAPEPVVVGKPPDGFFEALRKLVQSKTGGG